MTEREPRARLFVADGSKRFAWRTPDDGLRKQRADAQRSIRAYLYSGWELTGWGSAPGGHVFEGLTGFYLEGPRDGGFGVKALSDRLASGLWHAAPVGTQPERRRSWSVAVTRISYYELEAPTEDDALNLALSGEVEESHGETVAAVANEVADATT